MGISRNAPCLCGSGRKYKRCCLAAARDLRRAARLEDEVGGRIQAWAARELAAERSAALEEFLAAETGRGGDGMMSGADIELFSTWFFNDRPLPDGDTPAERYALRPELDARERAAAERIASARLGIHRVVEVRAGEWLLLENLAGGDRTGVFSSNVSREATRWDLLIGRLMSGDRPSLWGPTRVLEPSDERDLLAEIGRLGGGALSPDGATIARVLESHALEVVRFRPPNWDATPTFFTVEGDLVADASASWRIRDRSALDRRVRALGRLGPEEEPVIDITVARDTLVRARGQLPRGAILLEEAAGEDFESVPIATLRMDDDRLVLEAMSEQRLQHAIEIVEDDFGDLVAGLERTIVSIERRLAERRTAPPEEGPPRPRTGVGEETERRLLEGFMTDRMRRWVDDPHPQLDGLTPRQAASGPRRAEVVRLVRGIENGVERARRRGQSSADLTWLRCELALEDPLTA